MSNTCELGPVMVVFMHDNECGNWTLAETGVGHPSSQLWLQAATTAARLPQLPEAPDILLSSHPTSLLPPSLPQWLSALVNLLRVMKTNGWTLGGRKLIMRCRVPSESLRWKKADKTLHESVLFVSRSQFEVVPNLC